MISFACQGSNLLTNALNRCATLFALSIRLYLFKIFFWSGWLKVTSWASTLYLFENEYKIMGISPVTAAYLGTSTELILPILLVLGFGARIPAIVLFIFNILMVYFYPGLSDCQIKDSYLWGTIISIIIFYGPGKLSLDYWLQKKICQKYQY